MFSLTNTPNKLSENQLSFLSKYPTLNEYYTTKGQLGAAPFDKLEVLNVLLSDVKTATSDIMVNEIGERETLNSMPEGIDYVDDSDNKTDIESLSSSTDSGNADVEALLPQLNDLQKKVEEQITFKSTVNPVKKSWHGLWGGIKHKTSKRSKKGGRKTHKKSNNKKTTQKKGGRKMQKKSTNKKQ